MAGTDVVGVGNAIAEVIARADDGGIGLSAGSPPVAAAEPGQVDVFGDADFASNSFFNIRRTGTWCSAASRG